MVLVQLFPIGLGVKALPLSGSSMHIGMCLIGFCFVSVLAFKLISNGILSNASEYSSQNLNFQKVRKQKNGACLRS